MDKNSNGFTFMFAGAVCVGAAALLASSFNGLKSRIEANQLFDRQRNVLKVLGLYDPAQPKPRADLQRLYAERVLEEVLERRDAGVELTERKVAELDDIKDPRERARFMPFYVANDAQGQPMSYAIPISGRGLWSTLYGFLALKPDLNHVQGITFYQHGETPGLGAEVENPTWQAKWVDKQILDSGGDLVSITVKKGVVDPALERERHHAVDGLSGATITSKGVDQFVRADLQRYEPYFQKLRASH